MSIIEMLLLILVPLFHLLGILAAVDALFSTRTPQGAIAWIIALLTIPTLAFPIYLIAGRSKFQGYIDARRSEDRRMQNLTRDLQDETIAQKATLSEELIRFETLERLCPFPFTNGNFAKLLINGEAAFSAIFEAINSARFYVLVQFYIIRDDSLGRELRDHLTAAAQRGVPVYLLYDEIGCYALSHRYLRSLREAGVRAVAFGTSRGIFTNKFQINFRNHRKVCVVDGQIGFLGGLNAGNEYLGRNPKFGPWRDTHLQLQGPSVQGIQHAFTEDWYWATRHVPALNWAPRRHPMNQTVLILPGSPADLLDTCGLMFTHLIHAARKRIWLVSPYFVPDPQIISALQLAALRGVEIRILLPSRPDHLLVFLASFSFLADLEFPRIKIFRYQPGFLHQKVILIDDDLAVIGTANADNRSFRLNFEISALLTDPTLIAETEEMLSADFAESSAANADDYRKRHVAFRLAVKCCRLLAPVL